MRSSTVMASLQRIHAEMQLLMHDCCSEPHELGVALAGDVLLAPDDIRMVLHEAIDIQAMPLPQRVPHTR